MSSRLPLACIVPPDLLKQILLEGTEDERRGAIDTLSLDQSIRQARAETAGRRVPGQRALGSLVSTGGVPNRVIRDLQQATDGVGKVVRAEGQPETDDVSVNESYDGLGAMYDLMYQEYRRDSIDGAGMALQALVHFGVNYNNAFWDGQQMLFGDGDGVMFTRFTAAVDVIGHELMHGVTQYEANLVYSGQSGALNESMSDVFGSLVRQRVRKESAADADWLIGADCVGPRLAPALRSLKAPGTTNPFDRQPKTMDDFVRTTEDNGGVHINSGIPNHAFYLVATSLGGSASDPAGRIWFEALKDPRIRPNSGFSSFARATKRQTGALFGPTSTEATAVHDAWEAVKVKT